MNPLKKVSGRVAVLDRPDVDTDQIMPKQFLKRIERTGFGEFLFYDWKFEEDGKTLRDDFPLNNPAFRDAKILLAGRNFGCGSSREHAPWGLQDYGFDVIIAPTFADIFANNCTKIGLAALRIPADELAALVSEVDQQAGSEMTVDLETLTITSPQGRTIPFELDASIQRRLVEGLDDIGLSMLKGDAISAYEAKRVPTPDTLALAGK
jgi:3-isopropylmalate/(R)-2-methylmalate dehydratase small subunit